MVNPVTYIEEMVDFKALTTLEQKCKQVYFSISYLLLDFGVKKPVGPRRTQMQSLTEVTTAAYRETTLTHRPRLPFREADHKGHHKLTNLPHPPSTQSLTSSLAGPHLWYLLSACEASSSCLCKHCSSCRLQRAAGSRKLLHLYASVPEDAAPFSPIEPLSAPGELISGIDEPRKYML